MEKMMWPFKDNLIGKVIRVKDTEREVAQLKLFRDIGETFQYLGVTCVVTGHYHLYDLYGFKAELQFDYLDKVGKLQSSSLEFRHLPTLIKHNRSLNKMLTLAELQEKVIEQVDEIDIMDLLGLTTADIVYAFPDKLEDRQWKVEAQLILE